MANARRLRKREETTKNTKKFTLKIADKETSPFLDELDKAMASSGDCNDTLSSPFSNSNGRKSTKRKFTEISNSPEAPRMETLRSVLANEETLDFGGDVSGVIMKMSASPQKKKQRLHGVFTEKKPADAEEDDEDQENSIRLNGPNGMTINIKTNGTTASSRSDALSKSSNERDKGRRPMELELGIPDKDDQVLLPPTTHTRGIATSSKEKDSAMTAAGISSSSQSPADTESDIRWWQRTQQFVSRSALTLHPSFSLSLAEWLRFEGHTVSKWHWLSLFVCDSPLLIVVDLERIHSKCTLFTYI